MLKDFSIALRSSLATGLVAGTMLLAAPASAQTADQDQKDQQDQTLGADIVVTATRVRQGGAQDIRHFREVSLDGSFLPDTSDLTLEGLMGEHDLALPPQATCAQTFCLSAHAMPANLPSRPDDRYFIGLSFDTAIDADSWRGAPLSLIAVVDRSGSMSGEPMARVKEGLRAALGKLRKGDRLGIVLYGSEAIEYLPVTEVDGGRETITKAIDAIEIEGSTFLEAGLRKGYELADAELARSHGKTRLMLFTDENPNVGNTSAEGFMAQATAGSQRGVGLTTIGVGVHFDAQLATKVSSVRGGNLFYVESIPAARTLFGKEFFNMVSEVAHDVVLTMAPPQGYKVTGVFGVPNDLMTSAPDGAVSVTINTAFLSSEGGGVFVALGRDAAHEHLPAAAIDPQQPLLTGTLSYVDALTGQSGHDRIVVKASETNTPEALRTAQALVDEYLTIDAAMKGYHQSNAKKEAFALLDGLSQRLAGSGIADLAKERTLVDGLRDRAALIAGYRGEIPKELRPLALVGQWRVTYQQGLEDIARGDAVQLTRDNEFITDRKHPVGGRAQIVQTVRLNEKQLYIPEAGLVMNYRLNGDLVTLTSEDNNAQLVMRRTAMLD